MKNYIAFSEYPFGDFMYFTLTEEGKDIIEETVIVDASSMVKAELETRYQYERNTLFYLGMNGMADLPTNDKGRIFIFDMGGNPKFYPLNRFSDISKFTINNSFDVYKLFRTGIFGGLGNFDWNEYMEINVFAKSQLDAK